MNLVLLIIITVVCVIIGRVIGWEVAKAVRDYFQGK